MNFSKTMLAYISILAASVAVANGALNVDARPKNRASDPNRPTCTTLYPGARYWLETRQQDGRVVSTQQYVIQTESKFCRINGQRPTR